MHREEIQGTPFHVTGNEEQGYAITFGKYRVSEFKPSIREAIEDLDLNEQGWNIIARIAGIIADITIESNKAMPDRNK